MIGVSGVAHIASIVSLSPDPNAVIPETVAGAVGILKAASREPSVKNIVFTSSAIATGTLPQPNVERTLTADSWNDEASILAWAPPPYEDQRRLAVYAASKTEAEKTCWKFVRETKPGFQFNTVLPCAVIGPQLHPSHVTPGSPLTWFKVLLGGDLEWVKSNAVSPCKFLPFVSCSESWDTDGSVCATVWSVDVRDVARLHVTALINPTVKSERLFAYVSPFNWSTVLDIFRRIYPDKVFPEDIANEAKDLSVISSRERSVELLKTSGSNEFISLEESLKATVRDFVA